MTKTNLHENNENHDVCAKTKLDALKAEINPTLSGLGVNLNKIEMILAENCRENL